MSPVWAEILRPTEVNYVQYLRRLHGKWVAALASRSGPDTGYASFGDADYAQTWRMCCCWVHAQPVAVSNLPEAELRALQAQFNRDTLDVTFAPHMIGLHRQEFRSTDVPLLRSVQSGNAQLEDDRIRYLP